MSRYIPMPAYYDRMPVDISFVFEDEKPAGKHGFLKVDGEDLRFEDGTLGKFWGVNINGGANFPEHDYAERFARRLAQAGCNIVRFHQLDAEWDTPNIFAFTKGKRLKTTRQLDPVSMERMDYLIYCLKEQGIYVYLDMMAYRKFKEGDGVVDADLLPDLAKPWCLTNQHLIELQKEFITNLWTHYNPYTKLQYKDDPVFVLCDIISECDLFDDAHSHTWWYKEPEYYVKEFRGMFKTWLEEKGLEYDWENCPLYPTQGAIMFDFKEDVTRRYFSQMYDHMRTVGVKIPITGTNWDRAGHGLAKASRDMDYTDTHAYFYDWRWTNNERMCKNRSITSSRHVIIRQHRMALAGKPFFLSEWDMPWPNTYRAESPIYYASVAALQGWCGACIHTYAYSSELQYMNILGRELSSPVAGIPYREGIFSVWNDPAKFGLFYHSALITRRGDVSPADKKIAILPHHPVSNSITAMTSLTEQHRARMHYGEGLPQGYDDSVLTDQDVPLATPGIIVSDNGQLWRDLGKEIGAVDTARTKCFYGQLGKGYSNGSTSPCKRPIHKMNGLEIACATDFGVIAMSSLTDDPIETSDNILLSAIGRARNTNAQFDGDKMLHVGEPPIMAEVIDCNIRMKTVHGTKLKVWGINAEGFYSGMVPTSYDEDGYLNFRIGDENNPACYYLIVKE